MPVRNRIVPEMCDESGGRDYLAVPATLEEYREHCRQQEGAAKGPLILYNYSAQGFNRIAAMIDAGKKYRAMGLL
jgi:hypothetical protein